MRDCHCGWNGARGQYFVIFLQDCLGKEANGTSSSTISIRLTSVGGALSGGDSGGPLRSRRWSAVQRTGRFAALHLVRSWSAADIGERSGWARNRSLCAKAVFSRLKVPQGGIATQSTALANAHIASKAPDKLLRCFVTLHTVYKASLTSE